MKPSERLLARLRALGADIPAGAVIQRSYAGRVMRQRGAWLWWVEDGAGCQVLPSISSHYRVTDLLRAPHLHLCAEEGEWCVDPAPDGCPPGCSG